MRTRGTGEIEEGGEGGGRASTHLCNQGLEMVVPVLPRPHAAARAGGGATGGGGGDSAGASHRSCCTAGSYWWTDVGHLHVVQGVQVIARVNDGRACDPCGPRGRHKWYTDGGHGSGRWRKGAAGVDLPSQMVVGGPAVRATGSLVGTHASEQGPSCAMATGRRVLNAAADAFTAASATRGRPYPQAAASWRRLQAPCGRRGRDDAACTYGGASESTILGGREARAAGRVVCARGYI